jgi:hypothetical protein
MAVKRGYITATKLLHKGYMVLKSATERLHGGYRGATEGLQRGYTGKKEGAKRLQRLVDCFTSGYTERCMARDRAVRKILCQHYGYYLNIELQSCHQANFSKNRSYFVQR